MRKGTGLLLTLVLAMFSFTACRQTGTSVRPLSPYVKGLLSDTLSVAFRPFSAYNPKSNSGEIALLGPISRVALLSEGMIVSDLFDNIDGTPSADGLPDFAGEVISSLLDAANSPYPVVDDAEARFAMSEVSVRLASMALDTILNANNYNIDELASKSRAKMLVLAAPQMSAYGYQDIDTICVTASKRIPVISVVDAMLDATFRKNPSARRICIYASDSTVLPAYHACFERYSREHMLKDVKLLSVNMPKDSTTDFLQTFLSVYAKVPDAEPLDALLLDDYSLDPRSVNSTLEAVMNPYSEETLAQKKLLRNGFCIVDAISSVNWACYVAMRAKNIFTHNISWPRSRVYVTYPLSTDNSPFILLPFSFHYIKPEESVFMMASTPKTLEGHVQN